MTALILIFMSQSAGPRIADSRILLLFFIRSGMMSPQYNVIFLCDFNILPYYAIIKFQAH